MLFVYLKDIVRNSALKVRHRRDRCNNKIARSTSSTLLSAILNSHVVGVVMS